MKPCIFIHPQPLSLILSIETSAQAGLKFVALPVKVLVLQAHGLMAGFSQYLKVTGLLWYLVRFSVQGLPGLKLRCQQGWKISS